MESIYRKIPTPRESRNRFGCAVCHLGCAGRAGTMQRGDERELQFDVRCLDAGDRVEVFMDAERRWARGRFEISTAGVALVQLPNGQEIRFDVALRMGLRRILN